MDIILDSNIFLADPTFRGAPFTELLSYVRISGARWVISALVRDEVSERYREKLLNRINAARGSWDSVRNMTPRPYPDLPRVDVDSEVAALLARMEEPLPGVHAFLLDITDIETAEVVRRGIRRKRPASSDGEQLRDVILWLNVLRYAKTRCSADVVLISNDGGFQESNGKDLHCDLRTEADAHGLRVSFYCDIGSFLAAASESWKHVGQAWWNGVITPDAVKQEVKNRLDGMRCGGYFMEQTEVDTLEFRDGYKYEVNPGSSYVEIFYQGTSWALLTSEHGSHPHHTDLSKGLFFDRWKSVFSVKISARVEGDRAVSWELDEVSDLRRVGTVKDPRTQVVRHYDVF